MKHFMTILFIGLFTMVACDSDLAKIHYDEVTSQPAILAPIAPDYVLNAVHNEVPAIIFLWQKPLLNYSASVTTDLQIDMFGNHFSDAETLASTKTDSTYVLSVADLNAAVLRLLKKNGKTVEPLSVEFRLASSISASEAPLYSNVVLTTVTPYEE